MFDIIQLIQLVIHIAEGKRCINVFVDFRNDPVTLWPATMIIKKRSGGKYRAQMQQMVPECASDDHHVQRQGSAQM